MFKGFKKIFSTPFKFSDNFFEVNGIRFEIKKAKLEDAIQLYEIQKFIYPEYQLWSKQTYISEISKRRNIYLIIKHNRKIIGLLGLSKISNNEAHITNIGLIPEFRGNGLGKIMLNCAINLSKNGNYKKLTLKVQENNIQAINMYRNSNFIDIRKIKNYYKNNYDAIEMCKYLITY